jgi:cytochrome b6-f complex iron-sulfur subunit
MGDEPKENQKAAGGFDLNAFLAKRGKDAAPKEQQQAPDEKAPEQEVAKPAEPEPRKPVEPEPQKPPDAPAPDAKPAFDLNAFMAKKKAKAAAAEGAAAPAEAAPTEAPETPATPAEKPAPKAAAKPTPPKPAAAPRPAPPKFPMPDTRTRPGAIVRDPEDNHTRSRRSFLRLAALAWIALGAVVTGLLALLVRFLFPNTTRDRPAEFKAGSTGDFAPGRVDERHKDTQGAWIVNRDGRIYALAAVCTHLGCTPNWIDSDQKFKCPCHGSGYDVAGTNLEGPAPRPLERYRVFVADDGQLVVDKSRVFRAEAGEWNDPDSYVRA